jgi:predicted PurR-regulated permease PerM
MRVPFLKNSAVAPGEPAPAAHAYIKLDPDAIDSVFVAPKWLRDVGLTSWFAVGAALLLTALIALLALTATIVVPLILAGVIAAVAAPLVSWQQRHGIPRGLATLFFLIAFLAVSVAFGYAVITGIVDQKQASTGHIETAKAEIGNWLDSHDLTSGSSQNDSGEKTANDVIEGAKGSLSTLMDGVVGAISGLAGIVFFLAMTFISLVFLLKDGPTIRRWGERHMGVPEPVARVIAGRVIGSLRGYFFGVTIIAAFNALVVGIGAVALNVPLVATIMLVTFIAAYIPFIGAWAAGAFSVLIAFGAPDPETAVIGMIIITLLANGMLQQLVQPIAYGAALGIHPLAALVATIGGGCLFGSIGLILGAPMVSAAVRISADLANARAADEAAESASSPDDPLPIPGG